MYRRHQSSFRISLLELLNFFLRRTHSKSEKMRNSFIQFLFRAPISFFCVIHVIEMRNFHPLSASSIFFLIFFAVSLPVFLPITKNHQPIHYRLKFLLLCVLRSLLLLNLVVWWKNLSSFACFLLSKQLLHDNSDEERNESTGTYSENEEE